MIPDGKEPQVLFLSVWKPLRPETGGRQYSFAQAIHSPEPTKHSYTRSGSCRGAPELGIDEPEGLKTSANP